MSDRIEHNTTAQERHKGELAVRWIPLRKMPNSVAESSTCSWRSGHVGSNSSSESATRSTHTKLASGPAEFGDWQASSSGDHSRIGKPKAKLHDSPLPLWDISSAVITQSGRRKRMQKNRKMAALGQIGGRVGGRSTSKAKARAARENGKLGGRPRLQKASGR